MSAWELPTCAPLIHYPASKVVDTIARVNTIIMSIGVIKKIHQRGGGGGGWEALPAW